MKKYVLLLHDSTEVQAALSPGQMQQAIQKYITGGDRLRDAGVLHDYGGAIEIREIDPMDQ